RAEATVPSAIAAPVNNDVAAAGDSVNAEADDNFPLTDAQLDKWLACQYSDEANTAYNESMLLHLDGDLDIAALGRSLTHVASRHEALQLHFLADGSAQRIDPEARLRLSRVDLSGPDADARLHVHCQTQMSRPFDLTQAP